MKSSDPQHFHCNQIIKWPSAHCLNAASSSFSLVTALWVSHNNIWHPTKCLVWGELTRCCRMLQLWPSSMWLWCTQRAALVLYVYLCVFVYTLCVFWPAKTSFWILWQTAHASHSCKTGWALSWFIWSTVVSSAYSAHVGWIHPNTLRHGVFTTCLSERNSNVVVADSGKSSPQTRKAARRRAAIMHPCGGVNHCWDVWLSKLLFLLIHHVGNKLPPWPLTFSTATTKHFIYILYIVDNFFFAYTGLNTVLTVTVLHISPGII